MAVTTPVSADLEIDQRTPEHDPRRIHCIQPEEKPAGCGIHSFSHMKKDSTLKPEKARGGSIDPSKYKTAICRNWESTGICNFRGCTFAHGKGELRMARTSHSDGCYQSSPLHSELSHGDDGEANTRWNLLHQYSVDQPSEVIKRDIHWHVDQVLHVLTEAIDAERQFCMNQKNETLQLDSLLEKEKVHQMQHKKDYQEILYLQERVRYLENIIVQSHIDENSTHLR
ncbi:zinc finger-domain protein [Perkinsela sp. CCAP 1560/4]|nr:zinc finger-domain protein [Perkinsela sp. CCAP 1560/4]|eukprot:KNH04956.1 zinc finger-domain protein [Perkinsela sp. CCAP 1560/4]